MGNLMIPAISRLCWSSPCRLLGGNYSYGGNNPWDKGPTCKMYLIPWNDGWVTECPISWSITTCPRNINYTPPLKTNGWFHLKITCLKRKIIWTKPPFLGSMLVFGGSHQKPYCFGLFKWTTDRRLHILRESWRFHLVLGLPEDSVSPTSSWFHKDSETHSLLHTSLPTWAPHKARWRHPTLTTHPSIFPFPFFSILKNLPSFPKEGILRY